MMLLQDAKALEDQIVTWRRQLHQIPEVGIHLPKTREALCSILDSMGASYRLHRETSGIEVLIQGGPGGVVALRADMDALPLKEETGLPFASQNGCMHACGHDGHMAMLLGAAALLQARRQALPGTVKCIFQPGEEGCGGAHAMIQEGVLEHPPVQAMFGLHVTGSVPELGPGVIGFKKGPLMAGSDSFSITFFGRGGHISEPEHVHNPLYAAARAVLRVEQLSKFWQAQPVPSVVAVGAISAGEKSNVVPDRARLLGSVRTKNTQARQKILDELRQAACQAAAETGCRWELEILESNLIVDNDTQVTECAVRALLGLFSEEGCTEITSNLMASDDISEFFSFCPGSYLHLGCGFGGETESVPLHSPRFCLNEAVLWRGSAALAGCAVQWLQEYQEGRSDG